MDWVVAIVVVSTLGWLANNWIRAKHGYELEDEWGGKTAKKTDDAETKRLRSENRELNGKLDAMQDRMIVLEKIVTDRGYSLSEEIEALREIPAREDPIRSASTTRDAGVPLNINSRQEA